MDKLQREIPVLDNLRAIAAWSVCLYHFICTTTNFITPSSFISIFFSYGKYGVQLFFIISGLVIPWSLYYNQYRLKNYFRFFIKRLTRLEPPYLVSVLLMLGVIFLRKYSPAYNGEEVVVTIKQVLLHLGYLIPFFNGATWLTNVYWTLAIEFQYYIVIGIFYFLFVSKEIYVRILGYILFTAASIIFPSENFLPFWLPLFGIGILIFLYKQKLISIIEFIIVSAFFLSLIFIMNEITVFFVALLSQATIIFLFNYTNKIIAWFGKFSYSVYLIHSIIGAAVVNTLSHYTTSALGKVFTIVVGVIVTFISSYTIYICIEKPSKKLSAKLGYKKNNDEK